MVADIPAEWRQRCPRLDAAAWEVLSGVIDHGDAPGWNWPIGDRIEAQDAGSLAEFRAALDAAPPKRGAPAAELVAAVGALRERSPFYAERLPAGDLDAVWSELPTTERNDLATQLEDLVPVDVDLERLIVYGSSGSTARPLEVPHHPTAVAANFALLERLLAAWSVVVPHRGVACWNLGAQADSAVFATAISAWGGATLCKVSLHPDHWDRAAAARFAAAHGPAFCTGDPAAFAELLNWDLPIRPQALVSSAAQLSDGLRAALTRRYGCPVIDSYATTETGPVAAELPDGVGMAILPPDIHLEVVDDAGRPLPPSELGELCVTALRNPYLPVVRYRTGDHGRLIPGPAGELHLVDLQARALVELRAANGAAVCPVDVARLIHRHPVIAFRCHQRGDGSVDLGLRPAPGVVLDVTAISTAVAQLFAGAGLRAEVDPRLGEDAPGGKLQPFARDPAGGDAGAH